MKIVVTGGLGFIGSRVAHTLLESGHQVGIIDDQRMAAIRPSLLVDADVMVAPIESASAQKFIQRFRPDLVMHLAAYAAVGEGERKPVEYAENNIGAFSIFLKAVIASGCRKIIHAGSCAAYGPAKSLPVGENHPASPISWYGSTKLIAEEMLRRAAGQEYLRCVAFRIFNVIGPSLGKMPDGLLFHRAIQAAVSGTELIVNGHDYSTKDGTCIRDYVDVRDVAEAHLAAAQWLSEEKGAPCETINIGSGHGLSVLEILAAIEKTSSVSVKTTFGPSRVGDVPEVFANISKAKSILGWNPKRKIEESVKDTWDLATPSTVSHEIGSKGETK